jgi:metal-sulfur cluster biosynthetic enzyme
MDSNMADTPENSNKAVWDIESTHPEIVEKLREAFQQVNDPELGLNIIQLGLVRNVQITDGSLIISMIMTTPFCPYAPALIEMTTQKATESVDMPVIMALGMEPWDFSMMESSAGFEWGMWQ